MAFLSIIHPHRNIYTRTMLYGIGRAESDAEMRANFRILIAALLANWYDATQPDLNGVRSDIFDVVTSEQFYDKGYNKTKFGDYDARLWFCSYVGFEKVTSQWAKKNHPDCHGVFCMRIYNQDERGREIDHHTIQIYF